MKELMKLHDKAFDKRVGWNKPEYFTLDFWRKEVPYTLSSKYIQRTDFVLDIGSFTGELSILYGRASKHVVAIEFSKKAHDFALQQQKALGGKNVTFMQGPFEVFKSDISYEVVIMSHVLEHMINPVEMIKKAWSMCTRNMIVIIPKGKHFDDETHRNHWDNLEWVKEEITDFSVIEEGGENNQLFLVLKK